MTTPRALLSYPVPSSSTSCVVGIFGSPFDQAPEIYQTLRLHKTPGFDDICQVDERSLWQAMGPYGHYMEPYPGQRQNAQMFSNARDVSIRNSEINNVGGDLTINNYNVHLQPDSEQVQLSIKDQVIHKISELESKMLHAAKSVKNLLPHPFSNMLDITEKVAKDALKYPPLLKGTILLSKTLLYIPGVMNQSLDWGDLGKNTWGLA